MAERLPAAVKIMAKVAAGGDTKKLFKMMEKGQLDPNKYLPLFFQELEIESAGGIEAYKNSIRGSQNFAGVAFENVLGAFGGGGGNQGLINFWKDMKNIMEQLVPTAAKLGAAFKVMSGAVTGLAYTISHIVGSFSKLLDGQSSMTGWATAIGGAFLLIGTRMGRMTLGLTLLVGLLEDIAVYNRGGKSLIGEVLGEDGKGGAALAGLAGLAAFMGLKSLGGGGDGGKGSVGNTAVKGGVFAGLGAGAKWIWDKVAGNKGDISDFDRGLNRKAVFRSLVKGAKTLSPVGALTYLTGGGSDPVAESFNANYTGVMYSPDYYSNLASYRKNFEKFTPFNTGSTNFWEWQNPVSASSAMNPSVNLTINVSAQTNDGKELGKQIADQVMYIFPNR